MPRYSKGSPDQYETVARMMAKYHQPLVDAGVRIDVIRAYATLDANGDEKGPAVKLHGYPCTAIVRIVPYLQRVKGAGDAEIVIDDLRWDELSTEEQDALIDHEIEHIELKVSSKRKDQGAIMRDDADRPKLRLRSHDFRLEGFDSIIRRHGNAALEWQAYEKLATGTDCRVRQLWLPYVEPKVQARVGGGRRGKDAAVAD